MDPIQIGQGLSKEHIEGMDNKYSYLFSIPEHTEMPSDAYLFDPICK